VTGDSQTADTDTSSVVDGTAGEVIRSAPTDEDEDDESIMDT
jgi:hypothetical protein